MDEIGSTVKTYIVEELLQGGDGQELTGTTPLITGRILDSLDTLRLVEFIRQRYDVEIMPEEMSADYLDTVDDIARLIQSKM
jgi:acyl carrier protein